MRSIPFARAKVWISLYFCLTRLNPSVARELFTFQHTADVYASRAFATDDSASQCAEAMEMDSRRVFNLGFTSLRALINIVLALMFELLSLVLHIARKV